MTPATWAGLLVATVLAVHRIRPDHRIRPADADPAPTADPPPVGRRHRPARCGPATWAAWCDTLARDVRAGATLVAALRTNPAPDRSSLHTVSDRLGRGVPLADALRVDSVDRDEQAVLTVLAACAAAGGPAAQPLDRLAAVLRRRAADAAERQVHSAQARLSALVMTVIPVAVLLLLLSTSASVRTLTTSTGGALTLVVGLALNGSGWWWMHRTIRRRLG